VRFAWLLDPEANPEVRIMRGVVALLVSSTAQVGVTASPEDLLH
jgi:hypothetical protein